MKFNVDVETSDSEKLSKIDNFEKEHNFELPSDYRFVLLNYNELRLANDALGMILDENGEEITGLDGCLFSLEQFKYSSDPYHSLELVSPSIATKNSNSFFTIATLLYQGILLIGKIPENENKIYAYVPGYSEEPFFLANNIFVFFNEVIHIVE